MNPTQTQAALKITRRLRRLRTSEALRAMVRETRLSPDMFILPLFVCEGEGVRREVTSMPGVFNLSVDEAVKETAAARADGIRSVLLFGLPDHKDDVGSAAYDADAPVQSAIRSRRRPSRRPASRSRGASMPRRASSSLSTIERPPRGRSRRATEWRSNSSGSSSTSTPTIRTSGSSAGTCSRAS